MIKSVYICLAWSNSLAVRRPSAWPVRSTTVAPAVPSGGASWGLIMSAANPRPFVEFLASDFIARQLPKGFLCAAVSSQSQLQNPEVKKSNIAQISVLQDAQMLGHDQIVEGLLQVLAEFGLAESQHGVRGSVLLIQG